MSAVFTIITPVYNAVLTIEKSLKSIIEQEFKNYQYIIIDGGSTDGTLNILYKYRDHISYMVSEKDNGIYDAMNKGIVKATGIYIIFLGADDYLHDSTVLANTNKLIDNKRWDLIIGNIVYNNNIIVKPRFSALLLLHNSIHHQGAFYNKALFDNFAYSTEHKLISDYGLNLKLFLQRQSITVLKLDFIISLCGEGGLSRRGIEKFIRETNLIRSKYLPVGLATIFKILFLAKVKLWNAIRYK